jgi:tryptophan synthase alpha chain
MSKRLNEYIRQKKNNGEKLLSIFVTAGFPEANSTLEIVQTLDECRVDFIELGIPFSDPIADGPVIQNASDRAICNGINLSKIFDIIRQIRHFSGIPIVLMGYLNPIYKMGIESFIKRCAELKVDGLIIPDWSVEENLPYHDMLAKHDLDLIHLVAPNTPSDRLKLINRISRSFIYCVAYTGVTGQDSTAGDDNKNFLQSLPAQLDLPLIVGFGVKTREDYLNYTQYVDGVIIGSAFIQLLETSSKQNRNEKIRRFIQQII